MTTTTRTRTDDWTPGHMLGRVELIGVELAIWEQRDADVLKGQAAVRQAANTAMDQIDHLLRELYELRSTLVTEIRQDDDAFARRGELTATCDYCGETIRRPENGVWSHANGLISCAAAAGTPHERGDHSACNRNCDHVLS